MAHSAQEASIADKLAAFFGTRMPTSEDVIPGGRLENFLKQFELGGFQKFPEDPGPPIPPGIPDVITPQAPSPLGVANDFLTARPSAEEISGFLNTPSPIPAGAVPLPPNIGADIFDFFAGTGRETPPPPEASVPEGRPPSIPDALGGRSTGVPGGGVSSTRSPFISALTGDNAPLPDIPDPQDLLARLREIGPVNPAEVNPLPFILQGIAAGASRPEDNFGELVLNAGLGALSGRANATFERGRVDREAEAANRDFQIALANAEAGAQGEFFDRKVARTAEQQRRLENERAGRIAEQEQLQPSVAGGILTTRTRENDEIVSSFKDLRPPTGAGSNTALKVALGVAIAQANPSITLNFLQTIAPDEVEAMAEELNISLGAGLEPSMAQKKRLASAVLQARPELADQVGALSQLVGTLSGLGGRAPTGF
ncbi:MAG: hypothetical protein BMS9Abin11_1719 [Gammaproteobacteria bacterium]|nr:MAG: hypothetical protein BMS9Abin11_1719 [Gammaproteobacteria bacterium]